MEFIAYINVVIGNSERVCLIIVAVLFFFFHFSIWTILLVASFHIKYGISPKKFYKCKGI